MNDTLVLAEQLKQTYLGGHTCSYAWRKSALQQLKASIMQHELELYEALYADLGKSKEESWVTELGFVVAEINAALKHLKYWMKPQRVPTNLLNLPSTSYILHEPLGVVLIIGPWNYPLQLLLTPLVGAIAAGNTVMLKPSEFATATAAVIRKIIASCFQPGEVCMVEGDGAVVVPALMKGFRFNHVFYTGSTAVGKLVYQMAAEQLVPVTLELGGKSPCVVEADADLRVAARRIVVTKFSNAGQMCVAPDYLLVHSSVRERFVSILKEVLLQFFSDHPESSENYGRIINILQLDRLVGYLSNGNVLYGGRYNKETRFFEPTLMDGVSMDSPLMNNEVFGPILPIFGFASENEALNIIRQHPDPLAFYVFTQSSEKSDWWLKAVPAGGACVNNASWHLTNHHLPFGGRGNSGIGHYHGRHSFHTFSHAKAVLDTPTWFDPSIKYPPFKGKLRLFKWFIR